MIIILLVKLISLMLILSCINLYNALTFIILVTMENGFN